MKKLLSILGLVLLLGSVSVFVQASKGTSTSTEVQSSTVKVFYFYGTHRCATCMAVEKVSKEAVAAYEGTTVPFTSVNVDKDENKALIEQYNIQGQTLLIVGPDKTINLTNFAFMNARTHPEKLKLKIQSTLDNL